MAKSVHDDVLDAALNYVKNNGTTLTICSSEPTNYALATDLSGSGGYRLAWDQTLTFLDPSNGTSGRKLQVNAQTGLTVDVTGTATHVAIVKPTATTALLYVTTCTSQVLTGGNTVNTPNWNIQIDDPT